MMMDVFLISPPYGPAYGKRRRGVKHGLPPLGLACINGFVKSKGYRTRFVDLDFTDLTEAELVRMVAEERPRFVGITAVTTQIISAVRLAQAVKKAEPQVVTVLGGPHPSALPELTASYPGVDLVIAGEGEQAMLDLLEGKPYEKIGGLTWSDNGVIRSNPRRPVISDLDSLPLPDYEGLEINRYGHILNGAAMPVMSGRGCPYNCVFCASDVVTQRKCRYLSPRRFVDHIEDLVKNHGVHNFAFTDETFVQSAERTYDICEEILSRSLDITWTCQTRVNGIDKEIVGWMKRAGCTIMELGIESGDQEILDRIGKRIKKDKVRQACKVIRQAGLAINGFFILGLPYEAPSTVRGTIDFARELPLDFAQFAMFIPLPGSEGWRIALDGEVLRLYANDWNDFSRYTYPIVESDALSREELQKLHATALRKFYYRPKMIAKWLRGINSYKKLKDLFNMVLGFAQIARAKRSSPTETPLLQVTADRVYQLMSGLDETEATSQLDLNIDIGPPSKTDHTETRPKTETVASIT